MPASPIANASAEQGEVGDAGSRIIASMRVKPFAESNGGLGSTLDRLVKDNPTYPAHTLGSILRRAAVSNTTSVSDTCVVFLAVCNCHVTFAGRALPLYSSSSTTTQPAVPDREMKPRR